LKKTPYRPVEVVVMRYPVDAHEILETFPMSGIQNLIFIMLQNKDSKHQIMS